MVRSFDRRSFLKTASASAAGFALAGCAGGASPAASSVGGRLYDISLAEWSLHRTLRSGELDALDFPRVAREAFDIGAVEYVNQFFMDEAEDRAYLRALKARADDAGVRSLLIMIDREGALGAPDAAARTEAVENHYKWVEAAAFLGCHAVRVNAASEGPRAEQRRLAADGLHRLCTFAEDYDIDVLVENHGGLSSDGAWLASVIEAADHPRAGTLPDFGNFCIAHEGAPWNSPCADAYDRYRGVRELMPRAGAVSAKSHVFDADGEEARTDFRRMMEIVLAAGYHGHVGIEYEGDGLSEYEGIRATKRLLERVHADLAG